jgi:hypothetical protein
MSESYYTPIVTPEERIRQLEAQNVNTQNRNRQLQDAIDNGTRDMQRKLADINRESMERENQHNRVIGSLVSDIRESEIRNQERIKKQREDFERSLRDQRSEYLEIARQHRVQLDGLREDVNEIQATEENRHKLAVNRLADLNKLIQDVNKNVAHQRFAPGQLQEIIGKAKDAQKDINEKNSQSANVEIRGAYRDLVKLREEVRQKQLEFDIVYNETLQALISLLNQLKHKDIEVGKKIRNIDYWSEGEFSKLENIISVLKEDLERRKDTINTETVKEIFQKIGELEERQRVIVTKAQNAVLASIERERIGLAIAMQLEEANYPNVDGNGYECEDPRKAYIIRSKLLDIEECSDVVAIIEPKQIGDSGFQNGLLIVANADESEALKEARAININKSLKGLGCVIGKSVCNSHESIPELSGKNAIRLIQPNGAGIPSHLRERLLD